MEGYMHISMYMCKHLYLYMNTHIFAHAYVHMHACISSRRKRDIVKLANKNNPVLWSCWSHFSTRWNKSDREQNEQK